MATSRALNVLLLGLCLTAACVPLVLADISYVGETPTTGMAYYKGANYSDTLWDYVYTLDSAPPGLGHWGVEVLTPISAIWSPSGWTGQYVASVSLSDWPGLDRLEGRSAVIWARSLPQVSLVGFHFQTSAPPAWLRYDSNSTWYGETWSAGVPEPGSVFLASMLLASAGIWRRWRKHGKSVKL